MELKENIKRILKIDGFTLKGRASIDTMELIQSYKLLESKKEFIRVGVDPASLNLGDLNQTDRDELANISLVLKEAQNQLKELKNKDPENPRIQELELKINELSNKSLGMLANNNQELLAKALSYSPEIRENQKEFEKELKDLRSQIFDYLPKALNFEAKLLNELEALELLALIDIVIEENKIETELFF